MTAKPPRVAALEWGVLEVEGRPEPYGRLDVSAETRAALEARGVELHAAPTPEAVETYHRLRDVAPEVGALIHTTC